jgi:hypothetical protein
MRFLIIPKPDSTEAKAEASGAFDEKVFAAYMKFNEDMTRAGVLIAAEGLNPAGAHARVAISGGKRMLVDGPFTEAKEVLGGFYLIEVKSKEEAIEWARRCPVGLGGDEVLEIHQMTELTDLPPRFREIIAAVAPTWSTKLWR